MSGEGSAPSKHGRKPEKDDYSGKPAGSETAAAKEAGAKGYKNKAGCVHKGGKKSY